MSHLRVQRATPCPVGRSDSDHSHLSGRPLPSGSVSHWEGLDLDVQQAICYTILKKWGAGMSKYETPFTRKYWKTTGGTLIEEFLAVSPETGRIGRRNLDGLIVLDGGRRCLQSKDCRINGEGPPKTHEVEIQGQEIIIVQTKMGSEKSPYRLGMYLLGQAYFSKFLMERFHPKKIRSVAICARHDRVMEDLAENHEVEVVVYEEHGST